MHDVLVLVGAVAPGVCGAVGVLTAALELPAEAEAELRRSAKARGVPLAQEIADRLRLSLLDVSTEMVTFRCAGGDEDE